MANVKISELTALTPPAAADLVPVTDSSASQTKRTTVGEIVGIINGDVDVADDGTATISELPVSKLQDGAARQLLQTDAAGTGVEWTSNVDVPGTLDVTGAATLDSTLDVSSNVTLTSTTQSTSTVQARRFATASLGTDAEGKFQQNTGFAALNLSSDNTATGGSRVALDLRYDGSTVARFQYDGSASFASRILVGTLSQSGDSLLQIDGDRIRLATAKTPTSAADTGVTGEICWDADYIYVCTATNTWKRAGLSSW